MSLFRCIEGTYVDVFAAFGLEGAIKNNWQSDNNEREKDLVTLKNDLPRTVYYCAQFTVAEMVSKITDGFNKSSHNSYLQGDLMAGVTELAAKSSQAYFQSISELQRNGNNNDIIKTFSLCYIDDNGALCAFSVLLNRAYLQDMPLENRPYQYTFCHYRNITGVPTDRTVTIIGHQANMHHIQTGDLIGIEISPNLIWPFLRTTLQCTSLHSILKPLLINGGKQIDLVKLNALSKCLPPPFVFGSDIAKNHIVYQSSNESPINTRALTILCGILALAALIIGLAFPPASMIAFMIAGVSGACGLVSYLIQNNALKTKETTSQQPKPQVVRTAKEPPLKPLADTPMAKPLFTQPPQARDLNTAENQKIVRSRQP